MGVAGERDGAGGGAPVHAVAAGLLAGAGAGAGNGADRRVHPVAGGEEMVSNRGFAYGYSSALRSPKSSAVTALPDPGRYDCRAPPGRLGLAFKDARASSGA